MGMWKWGLEATASGALVRTPVPSGVEPAVRPTCRWLGMAKPDPGGVAQRERRRGFWPDAEGAGWEVFRGPVPEGREGSAYHPANARSILSLFEHLAMVWALGGHPETSAHPGVEGTRFRATRPLWSSHGLVGEKTLFACGAGPAGDGVACPEEYSGLAAPGLTPCREPQVFRLGYGSHSQPGNTRPMKTRQKSPCFSSNRSTMESMIGSGKIHMVDPAVESQSGWATE